MKFLNFAPDFYKRSDFRNALIIIIDTLHDQNKLLKIATETHHHLKTASTPSLPFFFYHI